MSNTGKHWKVIHAGCWIERTITNAKAGDKFNFESLAEAIARAKQYSTSAATECYVYECVGKASPAYAVYEAITEEDTKPNPNQRVICTNAKKCSYKCSVHSVPHTQFNDCTGTNSCIITGYTDCVCVPVKEVKKHE